MSTSMPRYTLEHCEELLRLNPAACAKLYGKIRSEVKTMEVRESEHRWMIRRALADGPKTAMQASNWARQNGDHHMDRPLAQSILMNLVKGGEIALKQMSGTPDLFSATDLMKVEHAVAPVAAVRPMENPLASPAAPSTPVCPKCGGLMFDGSKTCRRCYETSAAPAPEPAAALSGLSVAEIISLCAEDQIGKRRTVIVTGDTRNAAQNLRTSLNTRVNTRSWKWSVHVVKAHVLAVMKVGLRDEPDVDRPAPIDTTAPRVELASSEEIQMAASRNEIAPPAQATIQERPDWTAQPPAGKPWAAGRSALAEVDNRIAKLIEMRGALLRVIPMMETGEAV